MEYDKSIYFATIEEHDQLRAALSTKIENYYKYCEDTGRLKLWSDCYLLYYAGYITNGGIGTYGDKGEKRSITVNHFKNLLQHLQTIIGSQRLSFQPMATNSDYKSLAQTEISKKLLEYYLKTGGWETKEDKGLKLSLVFGEGWVSPQWNEWAGDDYVRYRAEETEIDGDHVEGTESVEDEPEKTKEGQVIKTGDIDFSTYTPFDVIRDVGQDRVDDHPWYMVRRSVNKYEFAEQYPEFKEEILALNHEEDWRKKYYYKVFLDKATLEETDVISVYTFWHEKSDVLPNGRQVIMAQDQIIVFDGDLPYKEIPLFPIVSDQQNDTAFGYSMAFDMMPIQKAYDAGASSVLTRLNSFMLPSIFIEKGTGIKATQISEGLKGITLDKGSMKPEVADFLRLSPELFQYLSNWQSSMEIISGVSQVQRGALPQGEKLSGSAMALLASQTIQFASGLQKSYIHQLERVAAAVISMLREYGNADRIKAIAGVYNNESVDVFLEKTASDVERVTVSIGNPMANTVSGREQIAKDLLANGIIKKPEQYLQVLETGSLEAMTQASVDELMLVQRENEMLMRGTKPDILISDNHVVHARGHVATTFDPKVRNNPEMLKATLAHIQEHVEATKMVGPEIAMIFGHDFVPPMPQQPGMPPVPPTNLEQGQAQLEAEPLEPLQEEQIQAGMGVAQPANMPNLPNNPLTGQPFDPNQAPLQ